MKNKVGIIGYGIVGKGMNKIFPDALVYDTKYQVDDNFSPIEQSMSDAPNEQKFILSGKNAINNQCKLAIICVPTPPKGMKEQKVNEDETNFLEVDLSIVEDTLDWLKTPLILIKSTVPPGTVDRLCKKYNKSICFSPEYLGESKYYTPPQYPDPNDARKHDFVIIGGDDKVADDILVFFKEQLGGTKVYFKCKAVEAECIKYAENTWGATKVTFANEWYEICKVFGASFNTVREGWVLDSRVEKMHSTVFENKRGFAGKCYPKDLLGIINASEKAGYEPKLLKQVWETNKEMLKFNK